MKRASDFHASDLLGLRRIGSREEPGGRSVEPAVVDGRGDREVLESAELEAAGVP